MYIDKCSFKTKYHNLVTLKSNLKTRVNQLVYNDKNKLIVGCRDFMTKPDVKP